MFERQRPSASGGGAEREENTECEAGSRFRAVSTEPDAGLEPTNRDHDLSRSRTLNRLSHPGAPKDKLFYVRREFEEFGGFRQSGVPTMALLLERN